jgi:Uma2 family endonuclease
MTVDEFDRLGDEAKGYELVDGFMKDKGMGALADSVALQMGSALVTYCRSNPEWMSFGSDTTYRLGVPNPWRYGRKPDASVLRIDQLPDGKVPYTSLRAVPVLAFEAVSPNDRAIDLERKLNEYLRAGVKLIWLVYPEIRLGRVILNSRESHAMVEEDVFDGGEHLPGLRVRLGDLLPPADRVEEFVLPPEGEEDLDD